MSTPISPTVTNGLRTRREWSFFVGVNADGNRITAKIAERDPQAGVTTEHGDTAPAAPAFTFTYAEISPDRRLRDPWVSCGADLPGALRGVTRTVINASDPEEWHGKLTMAELAELAELAEEWHLHDMTAECAHQTVVWETGHYGNRQPSLTLTEPCPVTGYRYGSAWLHRVMPDEIAARVRALASKGNGTD